MSENNEFMFLRGIKDQIKSMRNTTKPTEPTHPLLANLEKDIEANEREIRKTIADSDKPLFMRNFENDHNMKIESDDPDTSTPDTKSGQAEVQPETEEKKNKPTKLLQKDLIKKLAASIKTNVFGQDDVIDELVDVLKVRALKLNVSKEKPAGCYFLAGPSGCGKTELALSLAQYLGTEECPIPFLKINMGEYGMENDVTKLIGPPPGYKGFEQGGVLTNFVRDNPISIILFDECEKAHESMDKILLSVLDKGVATDNKGREVKFQNTIILSTSNLGAEVEYAEGLTQEQKNEYRMEAIKQGVRPEIINRYDSIFHCHALSQDIYEKVLVKFLDKLKVSMKEEHDIDLKFSPKIIKWATETSYDPAMGGRPARRFIEKIIIKPIADQMINDTFDGENNKEITMDMDKSNNVVFKNKNRKILGTLENTAALVSKLDDNKFSKRPKP